jgi:hypothetical protein
MTISPDIRNLMDYPGSSMMNFGSGTLNNENSPGLNARPILARNTSINAPLAANNFISSMPGVNKEMNLWKP